MRSRHVTRVCALALGVFEGAGCVGTADAPDQVVSQSGAIQAGQLETGFPAVGFQNPGCTGSLIAQSWVLTAAHCAVTSNIVFKTGTSSANFVNHATDKQLKHPTLDLMLLHLTSPLEGTPVLPIDEGPPPAVSTVCTAVGFGDHAENGVTTTGTKRSATEMVASTSADTIVVTMVSGVADHGDSGGPLLCNGRIVGVVRDHTDGEWPQHRNENYTPVDAGWIASVVAPVYTELALQNGWTADIGRRPAAALVAGIVQLKGHLAGGSGAAFTLPPAMRPATSVFVPISVCAKRFGRLFIQSSGVVIVEAEGAASDGPCGTSLEGVSFATSPAGFTPLTLRNGWTNAPFDTSDAQVRNIGGIVHFKGAIANGTTGAAFTLPTGFRPSASVSLPVTMCQRTKGRLVIQPSGTVTAQAETAFSNAQCFTSLDGASFAQDTTGFTALTLQNGWTNVSGAGTGGVGKLNGVVHLKGAISTTGINQRPFTLPAGFRPTEMALLPLDLCNATKGRMQITQDGLVTIQAAGDVWSNAQCFTSLDGVEFPLTEYTPLTLQNGWTNAPFSTSKAGAALIAGIVQLTGAIATTGTNPVPFTLPSAFRPTGNVYVPVNLCSASKGRLFIQSSGEVTVQAEGGTFSNAQCFTSLQGVSFAQSTAIFSPLTLQNSWNQAFGARTPSVVNMFGYVRFAGAISTGGSNPTAFTLPAIYRPDANVYVGVDMCNAAKGRLVIAPTGAVSVEAEGAVFSNAQCFTSLEGAWFVPVPSLITGRAVLDLTLQSGAIGAPFGTHAAQVSNLPGGVLTFMGAVSAGTTNLIGMLPAGWAPATDVYVSVDLCGAIKGRILIQPSGGVSVQGSFPNAQCFTSLDGASVAPSFGVTID